MDAPSALALEGHHASGAWSASEAEGRDGSEPSPDGRRSDPADGANQRPRLAFLRPFPESELQRLAGEQQSSATQRAPGKRFVDAARKLRQLSDAQRPHASERSGRTGHARLRPE